MSRPWWDTVLTVWIGIAAYEATWFVWSAWRSRGIGRHRR